jgi:hypothetical protein
LPDLIPDDGIICWKEGLEGRVLLLPVGDVVLIGSEVENLLRFGIERVEVCLFDRPAAVGDPVALLEVHRVEGGAKASRVVAGAAEVMQAGRFKRVIELAGFGAGVGVLHLVIVFQAAAFEEDDFIGRVVPFHGDAEAGGAGADDADIAFDMGIVGQGAGVGVHGMFYGFWIEKRAHWRASVTEIT